MDVAISESNLHINNHQHGDNEDDLGALIALLDQYHHHYAEIESKEVPSLSHFVTLLQAEDQIEIEGFYDEFKSLRRMLGEIFEKCLLILPEISKQIISNKAKFDVIQEQLDDTNLIIQGLKEKKKEDESHLAEITMLLERSKYDNVELSEKMSQKEQEFENESSLIRKTFMEVSESSEAEKKILESLYESNEKLSHDFTELKSEKKEMEAELYKLSFELNKYHSKIQSLESELLKKQQLINEYEEEIEGIHQRNRKKSGNSMGSNNNEEDDMYIRSSFNDINNDKKEDKMKLGEDLYNYKAPSVKELNGSFIMGTGIKRSVGEESDYNEYEEPIQVSEIAVNEEKYEREKPNNVTDPYFSHYILISQSVKIKEDCEDMLSIDMKPYYQEIIDKRIPMHLWDQWIKNRLRELLRKNEPNS